MENQLQDELIRLRHARKRDRIINLASIIGVDLCIILSLLAFNITSKISWSESGSPSSAAYRTQPELLVLETNTIRQPSSGPQIEDSLWSNVVSFETGFVWLNNANDLGLPAGLSSGGSAERKLYGLTWGHQMHCLMMIRDEYRALVQNTSEFVYGPAHLDATERARFHHIDHCFHYLRENIRCNRDMTLESAADYPDELGNLYHIDGYGIARQCRNEKWVKRFTLSHQPPDSPDRQMHDHRLTGKRQTAQ